MPPDPFCWLPGRAGSDFTEATDAYDLLYTFQEGDKFGFGIRIEGIGLTVLEPATFDTVAQAQKESERVYDSVPDWGGWIPLVESLPMRDPGGTPKHPPGE